MLQQFLVEPAIILISFGFLYWLQQNESKHKALSYFGVVVVAYCLGSIIGLSTNEYFAFLGNLHIAEVCMLLSLPLLLLSSTPLETFNASKQSIKAFVLSLATVVCSVVTIGLVFKNYHKDIAFILAGISALFTGGPANLSSLYLSIDMKKGLFTQLFASDLITAAFYLLGILVVCNNTNTKEVDQKLVEKKAKSLITLNALQFLGYALTVVGVCAGLCTLVFGEVQPTFIILTLTAVSILIAAEHDFKDRITGTRLGEFLLMAFCFFIGAQMTSVEFHFDMLLIIAAFVAVLLVNSFLFIIGCKLLKIPLAEALISHVASIYGPPIVLIAARNMRRNDLIAIGVTLGSIGIAVGTFVGIFVFYLLSL